MKHIIQNITKEEINKLNNSEVKFTNFNHISNDIYVNNSEEYKKAMTVLKR